MKQNILGIAVLLLAFGIAARSSAQYAARSDGAFIPLPAPLPSVGAAIGANASIVEPGYNTTVVRVTDINTQGSATNSNLQEFQTCCGGFADIEAWNADSSLLAVEDTGGAVFLLNWNAEWRTVTPMYGGKEVPFGEFSRTDPRLAYAFGIPAKDPVVATETFTDGQSIPALRTIADLATAPNCVPSLAGVTQWKEMNASWDGSRIVVSAGAGGQGSAIFVMVWDAANGCRWMNTSSGQVGGSWGTLGSVAAIGGGGVHSVRISGDGEFVIISTNQSNNRYVWTVQNLTVSIFPHTDSGHFMQGYSASVNNQGSNFSGPPVWWCKYNQLLTSFVSGAQTWLVPSLSSCFDTLVSGDDHQSWNNDDYTDRQPVFDLTYNVPNGTPSTVAWQNEVLAYSITQPGTVYREASAYATGTSRFFVCSESIGTVSQDGKYFAFTSDWGNTLGLDAAGRHRCDVFVAVLH